MQDENTKFTLCVLPTQIGKTFTSINNISTQIQLDEEYGVSIHVVFTMNTLLNNLQFAKRLEIIANEYGNKSICTFSSQKPKDSKYNHVKNLNELLGLCYTVDTCPKVVLLCSNSKRFDDGIEFLERINTKSDYISRAFVYYDELHNYISPKLRESIERIHSFEIVESIIALTATPDKIFEPKLNNFWSKIRLLYLDNFNDTNYVGYNDMIFNCVDDFFIDYKNPKKNDYDSKDNNVLQFISYILDKNPRILHENSRIFIPGHIRRISHEKIRELIFKINDKSIVIVINGIEKTLQYMNDTLINIDISSGDTEVCETISRIIIEHKLENRPLVITGFLCVGMGQTLTHKGFGNFTSAILSHIDLTNDEIYQLFGRLTGRIKDWKTYKQTTIYCPTIIKNRCITMEKCARNLINEKNGEVITQIDYRSTMNLLGDIGKSALDNIKPEKQQKINKQEKVKECDKQFKVFDTQEDAINFSLEYLGHKLQKRPTNNAPIELRQKDGQNPTVEQLIERWWGFNEKTLVRMCPTNNFKWCILWNSSFINIKRDKKPFLRKK